VLHLRNIKKNYTQGANKKTALNGITMSFRDQEFVTLLGTAGSGVTPLLNMLGGLDPYDSGEFIINGCSTSTFSQWQWDAYRNNSVGFIFRSHHLIEHLTILDNITLGIALTEGDRKIVKGQGLIALEKVGLKQVANQMPKELTEAQLRRIGIARALVGDPAVILANEPTATMEEKESHDIMKLIKEIAEDKLVIMVTANEGYANSYADRIVAFDNGEIIGDTNPYVGNDKRDDYELQHVTLSHTAAIKLTLKYMRTKKWHLGLITLLFTLAMVTLPLFGIVLPVVALTIMIIHSISDVKCRESEISMMRSLGARNIDIARLIITQNVTMGFLASFLGMGATYGITLWINRRADTIAAIIHIGELTFLQGLALLFFGTTVAAIGGFIPAYFATKINPVVTFKEE